MRKSATIRTIHAAQPILEVPRMSAYTIDGWHVFAPEKYFEVGDQCIYFELDSFLPQLDSRFGYLMGRPAFYEGRFGCRLVTTRLGSYLGQGTAIKLSEFPEIIQQVNNLKAEWTAAGIDAETQ